MENTHINEIHATRVGGLGSSDAKMVLKIGRKGIEALSATDKKRLRVMQGIEPYTPTPSTPAMDAGHKFEDYMQDYLNDNEVALGINNKAVTREKKMSKDIASFGTFAHADFTLSDCDNVWVMECKFSQNATDKVVKDYAAQCQWYYMLGASDVTLVHGSGSVEPFEVNNVEWRYVDRNDYDIHDLKRGLLLIDEYLKGENLNAEVEVSTSDLLPYDASAVEAMAEIIKQIKFLEKRSEEIKSGILSLMEGQGIDKITNDLFTITRVKESKSTTFDKKALFRDNPQISENQYTKEVVKKPYVKIVLK